MQTRERRKQTVGDMIRVARVAQRLKQVDVARLILTTQPMISAFDEECANGYEPDAGKYDQ